MHVAGIRTRVFSAGEQLLSFILEYIPAVSDGDIIVITSKIVALSESRIIPLEQKKEYIRTLSKETIATPWADLTLTGDGWHINAGVDESNAHDGLIVLPSDPYRTAQQLQNALCRHFSINHLGIVITDTRSVPLRGSKKTPFAFPFHSCILPSRYVRISDQWSEGYACSPLRAFFLSI